jgi:AcrR family transcriptional regulator
MIPLTDLSPKGLQTRRHIYETAITLFEEQGYDETTIRDIADAAGISIGLNYRYFARKEDIIMSLYQDYIESLIAYIDDLPPGQMADRYTQVLEKTIQILHPHRRALMALFGVAMHPESGISLMGTDDNPISRRMSQGYHQLVLQSDDALRQPKAEQMGVVLYTFHMLVMLFWLYDRSNQQSSTVKLIGFVHELFKMLRPMFFLPVIPQAIAKLSRIVMPEVATETTSNGVAEH